MVSFMGSLVYDWLLNAGDEKLAKKFKKEAKPEPLPPNSPRLACVSGGILCQTLKQTESSWSAGLWIYK